MSRLDTLALPGRLATSTRHARNRPPASRHRQRINVGHTERNLSFLGGSALIGLGLLRGRMSGLAMAGLGLLLAQRGFTGHCDLYEALGINTAEGDEPDSSALYEHGMKILETITINRPAQELYDYWRKFENHSQFMPNVESVRTENDGRTSWRLKGPGGTTWQYEVRWDGVASTDLPRRTFGYLPEERGLYPRLTVIDQLVYFASLYGERPEAARANAHAWLERFRMPDLAGRRAEELSKGNQQKVQFIAAILHSPDVLLMDEPFTGLDPVNLALLRDAFIELRDEGRTIVFSTHQMEIAEALCESLVIVDHGRLVASGTLTELKRASRAR